MKHVKNILRVGLMFLLSFSNVQAQMASYHLGNAIYQNNQVNPAYFPKGKWFVGLPAVSQLKIGFNSSFSYSDVVKTGENDVKLVDMDQFLSVLKTRNSIHAQVMISDFHIGFRRENAAISFFSNERAELDVLFPKSLVQFVEEGYNYILENGSEIKGMGMKARIYRETGFGYTYVNKKSTMSFGYRLKYLQGILNATVPRTFEASFEILPSDQVLQSRLNDANLKTAGGNLLNRGPFPYVLKNKNAGLGLDLGLDYRFNPIFSASLSVIDIGYIRWKEDTYNYGLNDASMDYTGTDFDNLDGAEETISDQLIDQFERVTFKDPYTEWNPVKTYLTGKMRITESTDLVATTSSRFILGNVQMTYSAGATHKFGRMLTFSGNITKLPQQMVNVGLGFVADLRAFQLYAATDRLIGQNLEKTNAHNAHLGINLIFGRYPKRVKLHAPSNFRFLGRKDVKVKAKEDKIYLIIPKQNRKAFSN